MTHEYTSLECNYITCVRTSLHAAAGVQVAHVTVKDIGVQCSLPVGPKLPISFFPQCSSPIPSDSSQSEHQLTDHDAAVYTLQDESS